MIISLKETGPVSYMQEDCHTRIAKTKSEEKTHPSQKGNMCLSQIRQTSFLFYIFKQHSLLEIKCF